MGNFISGQSIPQCPAQQATVCAASGQPCPVQPICPLCVAGSTTCPVCTNNSTCQITTINAISTFNNKIDNSINQNDFYVSPSTAIQPTEIPIYDKLNMPISYFSPVYGDTTYYWEGLKPISTSDAIFNTLSLFKSIIPSSSPSGKSDIIVNNDPTYIITNYTTQLNKRYVICISNTTVTNAIPNKYVKIKVPITTNVHNSIFILTRTRDAWSNINMFICDTNLLPIQKIQTSGNSFVGGIGNTSFLGPFNNVAINGYYEWLHFSISSELVTLYKNSNNEIIVSLNVSVNSSDNILYIAGIAVVPNYYGITTLKGINLFWNCNNSILINNGTNWLVPTNLTKIDSWNEEIMVTIPINNIYKIKFPILSTTNNIVLGVITSNNSWHENVNIIYIGSTQYFFSPSISGRYGNSIIGRGIYRYAKCIYLTSDEVTKYVAKDSYNNKYIEVSFNLSNQYLDMCIRGFYTENIL